MRGESLRVRGVSTGRTYVFTPGEPIQAVHPADATILLRSGHFRPGALAALVPRAVTEA